VVQIMVGTLRIFWLSSTTSNSLPFGLLTYLCLRPASGCQWQPHAFFNPKSLMETIRNELLTCKELDMVSQLVIFLQICPILVRTTVT
jgi:hypothetical protein